MIHDTHRRDTAKALVLAARKYQAALLLDSPLLSFGASQYTRNVSMEDFDDTRETDNPGGDFPSETDSVSTQDGADSLAAVMAERDRLSTEVAALQDRILRTQAEFQNLRRRVEKEKVEFLEYAATEAVRALLPIVDDFERALKIESADREYVKGMELIYQRLVDSLKKLGLEPIASVGKPFDPHVHHAVEKKETEQAESDTILEEYQRGYNFKGRLLRPAMVKVAVSPVSKAE
jgi:molecular chaperone GrpE